MVKHRSDPSMLRRYRVGPDPWDSPQVSWQVRVPSGPMLGPLRVNWGAGVRHLHAACTAEEVDEIVRTSDKRRFEFNNEDGMLLIRAGADRATQPRSEPIGRRWSPKVSTSGPRTEQPDEQPEKHA